MAAHVKDPDAQNVDRGTPTTRSFQPGMHAHPGRSGCFRGNQGRVLCGYKFSFQERPPLDLGGASQDEQLH